MVAGLKARQHLQHHAAAGLPAAWQSVFGAAWLARCRLPQTSRPAAPGSRRTLAGSGFGSGCGSGSFLPAADSMPARMRLCFCASSSLRLSALALRSSQPASLRASCVRQCRSGGPASLIGGRALAGPELVEAGRYRLLRGLAPGGCDVHRRVLQTAPAWSALAICAWTGLRGDCGGPLSRKVLRRRADLHPEPQALPGPRQGRSRGLPPPAASTAAPQGACLGAPRPRPCALANGCARPTVNASRVDQYLKPLLSSLTSVCALAEA